MYLTRLMQVARMIKIEHSVFALPFAYIGVFLAARGWPGWWNIILVGAAMVAVRSYSMAVNRVADLPIDRENPRTQNRELVTGVITPGQTWTFIGLSALVFILACAAMNSLCLALSVPVLVYAGMYSYVKRVSWLCHFVLGSVLGLAPLGGWLAVNPDFTLTAWLFFFGVTFWVAGFDILYATQDMEFDKSYGIRSIPARFGIKTALVISSFCHVNTALFFLLAGASAGLDRKYYLVWAVVSALLLWEHRLIKPHDLSRVNMAFFTLNGVVSVFVFVGVLLSLFA